MTPDWAALGLTHNPFEHVPLGTHLDWVELPAALLAALATRPARLELLGPEGVGKSTLLHALAAQEPDAQLVHADQPPLAWPATKFLGVDEADRLPPARLASLGALGPEVTVVLCTHRSLRAQLPGLTSVRVETGVDWVARRFAAASLTGAPSGLTSSILSLARTLRPTHVNHQLQRVLYELCENLARGLAWAPALADAHQRVAASGGPHSRARS